MGGCTWRAKILGRTRRSSRRQKGRRIFGAPEISRWVKALMTSDGQPNWGSIIGLISEIKRCDNSGLVTPSLAMAYICIDSLANLSRPAGTKRVTRGHFRDWVEKYLKGHPEQPYEYRGSDVYAARCAFLHTYGSDAELHVTEPDTVKYIYHDGGRHIYNPHVEPGIVIIGTRSFVDDVVRAANNFLEDCGNNAELKELVEARLVHVFNTVPYPSS